jgi:hypothetical protein
MIETLITILVFVIIAIIVWYIVKVIAAQFGFPPMIVQLVGLVIGLILLLYVIQKVLPGLRMP